MSGSAGGEIGVALIGAAIVAPIVVAAGVGYGMVKTTQFLAESLDEAWESHERIQEVRREEARLASARHEQFRGARERYERVRALIAADVAQGSEQEIPPEAPELMLGASLAEQQSVTADLMSRAGILERTREAASSVLLARKTAAAMAHRASGEALLVDTALQQRAAELADERAAAAAAGDRAREEVVSAALAEANAAASARVDARARRRISTSLAAVPTDLDADLSARLTTWLSHQSTIEPSRMDTAVYELDAIVDTARTRATDRAHFAGVAAGIIVSLAGCDTPVADEITRRAQGYLDGLEPWDPELINKAQNEITRWTQKVSDFAAAAALAAALENIGYRVGEDFSLEVTRDQAFVHHDDLPDHAVAIDLKGGKLALAAVREGNPATTAADIRADTAAEARLCHDIDLLERELAQASVAVDLPFREDPGASAVEVVDRRERARRRERRQQQERAR